MLGSLPSRCTTRSQGRHCFENRALITAYTMMAHMSRKKTDVLATENFIQAYHLGLLPKVSMHAFKDLRCLCNRCHLRIVAGTELG